MQCVGSTAEGLRRGVTAALVLVLAVVSSVVVATQPATASQQRETATQPYWSEAQPMGQNKPCRRPGTETLSFVQVGYLGDHDAAPAAPAVGEVYYVGAYWEIIGFPCYYPYVSFELQLPAGTEPAIDAANPVRCNSGARGEFYEPNPCPSGLAAVAPGRLASEPFKMGTENWQSVWVPVRSSASLDGICPSACLSGSFKAITEDGPSTAATALGVRVSGPPVIPTAPPVTEPAEPGPTPTPPSSPTPSPSADLVPPTRPTLSLAPVTLTQRAALSWSVRDEGSGIARHEVRSRRGTTSGRLGPWSVTTTAVTRWTPALAAGSTRCVQVRAVDLAGNRGPWSQQACTSAPLDDRSLVATGKWVRRAVAGAYLRTTSRATVPGSTLRRAGVSADRAWVLAATCPACGTVQVLQGSRVVGTVSLRGPARVGVALPVRSWGTRTRVGVVTLRTAGRGAVVVDGLVLRNTR